MRRIVGTVIAVAAVSALGGPVGARDDQRSEGLRRLAQVPIEVGENLKADGSDLAFQGDLVVAGTYDGIGLFRILNRKPYLEQISFYNCPGAQGDVSVFGDYVFYSIDSASSNEQRNAVCNNTDDSAGKEGVRIVDISDPRNPRQVKFVETQCGSHTHTLLPDGRDLYIYVLSYPIVQETSCHVVNHRRISVIRLPGGDAQKAKVVSMPEVTTTIGCHDVSVYPAKKLAAAACISEGQIWDIRDPDDPQVVARIYNPLVNIWHSGGITWDGKYAVFGDEFLGSITGTCTGPKDNPVGAMWFYDLSEPTSPRLAGYYGVPQMHPVPGGPDEASYLKCTTHNYNIVPMRDPKRYVAVVAHRSAGISAVDFSDPGSPKTIGLFQADEALPDPWAAYWYNGRVYSNDNDSLLGIGVFELQGAGRPETRYFDDRLNPQTQVSDFH